MRDWDDVVSDIAMQKIDKWPASEITMHPVDALVALRSLLDSEIISAAGDMQPMINMAHGVSWALSRMEELSTVIATLRNADYDLEHSTDIAVRVKANADKAQIYAIIDKSMQESEEDA